MTTPNTTPTLDRMTAAELRDQFANLHTEIDSLRAEIATIRETMTAIADGLQQTGAAATDQDAAPTPRPTITFIANSISLDYIDGKPAYKARGGQFTKFGVRIWPEALHFFNVTPENLKPGINQIQPLEVIAELTESGQPRKVIGKA